MACNRNVVKPSSLYLGLLVSLPSGNPTTRPQTRQSETQSVPPVPFEAPASAEGPPEGAASGGEAEVAPRVGMDEDALLVETACTNVLKNGLRTADIMAAGSARVGTSVMGESILRELDKLAA